MIRIRPAGERGHANHGWLDTRHTFSFARYHDPDHMGFRALRVINDDVVAAASGFGEHPHADMEIVTYVVRGALEHRDSMGTGSVLRRGDVQRMTAGRGVTHSELNPSKDEELRLLQIWIHPAERGLEPGYEEASFPDDGKRDRLRLLVSPDGAEGSLRIHQDVSLRAALLGEDVEVAHELAPGRHAWVQMVDGRATLNGAPLAAGDGAAITDETSLALVGGPGGAELLLFDLA